MFTFKVIKQLNQARLTALTTPHGEIQGPFFQFVATQAAIRGQVFSEDLEKLGVQIILANTLHLHLRPGEDAVAQAGGLHAFMQWDRPVTTDSGGYQVFSLAAGRTLDKDGVTFRSPLDGSPLRLTPESAVAIQRKLGTDIIMPLDVCTPFRASREEVAAAVDQTIDWARRCKRSHEGVDMQVLYGIIQGGVYADLREKCATALRELGFFGYAIGGELRVSGENAMEEGLAMTVRHLPDDAPRYHMGAGAPGDIVRSVRLGVDHFDCVLPIRNARHGKLYYDLNLEELVACLLDPDRPVRPEALYRTMDLRQAQYRLDQQIFSPGNPAIGRPYTRAYVHHLLRAEPPSGYRLGVLHNIYFYVQLMKACREVLRERGS